MINILLFSYLQETIGVPTLQADLANHTVHQVKEWMETQYPDISLQHVMTAVNEEFALDTTVVKEGDTIAFIPPISGG